MRVGKRGLIRYFASIGIGTGTCVVVCVNLLFNIYLGVIILINFLV